ncbi:hypothetical protein [Synechococcus sp. CBW1108]|uniref:hypothetical protein n=1 Tax=Synechococcus sp. CBW1108 TaxID=1353147 RepID=UPI0018CF97BB|nr:hypothetical protein [Synechococcus sp. CBW1108]QPN71409.1 hypothetical protein H8F27_07570 [Synechococcus sp. CBW1108]
MSLAILRSLPWLAAAPLALLALVASPAGASTPLAVGSVGAETFDPVARAQLLATQMARTWSGGYQSFGIGQSGPSQSIQAELRLASVTPMGQMIDLRGELTLGGVTTPVQGNLNAESDQLDLVMLCQCEVAGLEMGGVFSGLEGLQLSGWQSPRLTNPGGRLDLKPLGSSPAAGGL